MPVFETFAKRLRRKQRGGKLDVYHYDTIPPFLRKQVVLIMDAALGPWDGRGITSNCGNRLWQVLCDVMERELETFPEGSRHSSPRDRCLAFVQSEQDVANWLSFIEPVCRLLDRRAKSGEQAWAVGAEQEAADALSEINDRFRESAFGYQYQADEIIRVDDQYVHAEVVKPTLAVLTQAGFEKANEEFMTAHRQYRSREYKDAIVAANRAFESTLKAICAARRWSYPEGARAVELVTTVRNKGLFPDFLDNGLNTYVALMKTGLPGVRNNAGGHGEAPSAPDVPGYMAAYAIHLTASNILLVVNAHLGKG